MRCAQCGSQNPAEFRFCASCGAPLVRRCSACGADLDPEHRFCGRCGQAVEVGPPALDENPWAAASRIGTDDAGQPVPTYVDQEIRGGRRHVTVLFADLVGYSTLAERMDPEELQLLMNQIFSVLAAEVTQRGGDVEKFIGDAIMATFGASVAHEDDPDRAVQAALAMLRSAERHSATAPIP